MYGLTGKRILSNDWQIETGLEPRLRQKTGIEKSQKATEKDELLLSNGTN